MISVHLIVVAALILSACTMKAATYYVDSRNGSDAHTELSILTKPIQEPEWINVITLLS